MPLDCLCTAATGLPYSEVRRARHPGLGWRYRWTSRDPYFCPWTPSRTVLRRAAAVNPIVLYVLALIMTVILLAVVGAGFLGWVFGLLFIPFIVTVIAMTVID